MTFLRDHLEELGLLRYHDVFVSEGFDTWETLQEITESDLYVRRDCLAPANCLGLTRWNRNALDVKLGHRRVSLCHHLTFLNLL